MHNTNHHQTGRLRTAFSFTSGIAATLVAGIAMSAAIAGAAIPAQPGEADVSSFVPITPCRLMDTRPGDDNVGPRATPLAAGETHVQQVTGVNGDCTIPAGATAVALNATAVGATAVSYLTFFPADADLPLSSNLNTAPGQPPTPNKVDVALSDAGAIGIFNAFGQVNVIVDVTGYYVPETPSSFATSAHDDGGTLSGTASSVVQLTMSAPVDGAAVASSFAELGTLGGGRADCSISEDLTLDTEQRQIFTSDAGGFGSISSTRTFEVAAGEDITISLVCRVVSGSVGVNEADLSAIFVPSFVPQAGAGAA